MASVKGIVRDANGAPLNGALVRVHRLDTGAVLGEATSATVAGAGDPLDSMVALRLNFDNGATDTSQYAHTTTLNAGAVVVPGAGKFGGALDCTAAGNDAHLAVQVAPTLRVVGAFCLEFYLKLVGVALDWPYILAGLLGAVVNSISFQVDTSNNLRARVFGTDLLTPPDSRVFDQWMHFAITRDAAGSVRLFMNGVLVDGPYTKTTDMTADPTWKFGAFPEWAGSGEGGRSLIDEVVLTIGSERYPAAGFTPPAEPSTPAAPPADGAYEVTNAYTGESYAVAIAPTGGANPVLNHLIHRVIPA
jgi:hypothetical protein